MRDLMIYVKEIKGSCDIMKVGYYCIVRGSRLSIPEGPYSASTPSRASSPLNP